VVDERKLQTLSEKFALIENIENTYYIDGIEIINSSPLFMDGKFYEISQVLVPRPNLYQYLQRNNPAIHKYIDTQDTIVLDMELSTRIGFDEQGRTIYDSVTSVLNFYEQEYFPISKEFRDFTATLVLPDQIFYEFALDEMAGNLGGDFNSHEDIPAEWQNNVLIPLLLHKGTYGGSLAPEVFMEKYLPNINGDTIVIDFEIDPESRTICSNGLAYHYASFTIEKSLYLNKVLEAETHVDFLGLGRYSWKEDVKVEGNLSFRPDVQELASASNDTVVNIDFGNNYRGKYALTFKLENIFPRKYRFVWRTNYRFAGMYSVYVNGEKIKLGLVEYEEYDTYNLINGFFSVEGYKVYPDKSGVCNVDGWVNNIDEYGDVTIKLEYLGPGSTTSSNGLYIDHLSLLSE
jgi:hypothetical protein